MWVALSCDPCHSLPRAHCHPPLSNRLLIANPSSLSFKTHNLPCTTHSSLKVRAPRTTLTNLPTPLPSANGSQLLWHRVCTIPARLPSTQHHSTSRLHRQAGPGTSSGPSQDSAVPRPCVTSCPAQGLACAVAWMDYVDSGNYELALLFRQLKGN